MTIFLNYLSFQFYHLMPKANHWNWISYIFFLIRLSVAAGGSKVFEKVHTEEPFKLMNPWHLAILWPVTPFVGQSVRDKCRALILGQPLGSPTATFASEGQLLETLCLSKIVKKWSKSKNSIFVIDEAYFHGINVVTGFKGRLTGEMQCVYICGGATPRHCSVFNHQLLCPFVLFVSNMMMITTLSLREKGKGESALIFSC